MELCVFFCNLAFSSMSLSFFIQSEKRERFVFVLDIYLLNLKVLGDYDDKICFWMDYINRFFEKEAYCCVNYTHSNQFYLI